MKKYIKTISLGLVFGLVLVLALVIYPNNAKAADAGEFVYFRIDTELDVLNDKGVTVEWSCNGTASGSISETAGGIASESTQLIDGIVKVASASAEMTNATCIFGTSDTIQAKSTIDGWVTRRWSIALPASGSAVFTTTASQDYNFVVGLIKDELGGALVVNGTTASASYSGTTASSSYSGGYKYIAATADGTLTGGADGYVNKTLAVTWSSDYATTSKSADFNSSTTSTYNGTPLPFAVKVNLDKNDRSGLTYNNISGATLTAGNSFGTACTDNSDGDYYCAVPLAHTGVLASAASILVGGQSENVTCTYTDRTAGGDAQSTCTITANEPASGGGPSNTTPTSTPTPTPTSSPTPTPEPGISPTPTPFVSSTPTPSMTPTLATVKLFRKVSDPKVYVQASDGTLTWVKTLAEFNAAGYKWSDVKVISGPEFANLGAKSTLGVKKGIVLNVRKSASTASIILGKMKLNDTYQKTGQSGVWSKINFKGQDGWVHSSYTVDK